MISSQKYNFLNSPNNCIACTRYYRYSYFDKNAGKKLNRVTRKIDSLDIDDLHRLKNHLNDKVNSINDHDKQTIVRALEKRIKAESFLKTLTH